MGEFGYLNNEYSIELINNLWPILAALKGSIRVGTLKQCGGDFHLFFCLQP